MNTLGFSPSPSSDGGGDGYATFVIAIVVVVCLDASKFRLLCDSSSACAFLLSSLTILALAISSSRVILLVISCAIFSGSSSPKKDEAVSLLMGDSSSNCPRGLLGGAPPIPPPKVGVEISVATTWLMSRDGFLLRLMLLLLLLLLMLPFPKLRIECAVRGLWATVSRLVVLLLNSLSLDVGGGAARLVEEILLVK